MRILILISLYLITLNTQAQDSLPTHKIKIDLSGYLDTYYSYNFEKPVTNTTKNFLYNYNKHNEFNTNIALLRATATHQNIYAKIAIQAGTYVTSNYTQEETPLLNEAYIGIILNKKTTLEAGIMPSYIGFETATSHTNLTTTRSILAENSPYYMTGIKLSQQINEKWMHAILITNGWQKIKKENTTITPAIGTQIIYKPTQKTSVNWNTFIGKENYNNHYTLRLFSNFFINKTWNNHYKTIIGLDNGYQQTKQNSHTFHYWYSPILINQYKLTKKWNLTHRIEYYNDKNNIIINNLNTPFKTLGNSINLDFLPNPHIKIRTEAKWYHASHPLFNHNQTPNNYSLTQTLSFEF